MEYSKLSIVIPVYNEIETIHEILKQVSDVDVGLEKEIILVDDCSTDGTRDILKKISESEDAIINGMPVKGSQNIRVVFHEQNRGKGAALRTGFESVTGDIMVVQDADLEYEPQDYVSLIKPILDDEADVVYGSRFLRNGRPEGILFSSFIANKILTSISNLLTGFSITDMETCYKMLKTSVLKELKLTSERFGIEPEITAQLAKRNVRLVELPIAYHGRDHATGKKINWKDGVAAIYHIFRFNLKK